MAAAFLGSPATFKTGDMFNPLSIGNVNTLPTRQLGLLKFDIGSLDGQSAIDVTLNLKVDYFVDNTPTHLFPVQTINIYALNYNLTSSPFVFADIDTTDVTLLGSIVVSTDGFVSLDLTQGFATAQANGFEYFSLRLENITVLDGPFGDAAFVGFDVTTPNLSVTTIPEPSTYAMLSLALGVIAIVVKRRASIDNQA